MAIVFTITDAGRAALVDPDNNGTNAVVIAEVGLGSGRYAPAKDQTELRSPIKRVDTIAGQAVSDDTLHVTVQDETGDAYQVGEIGLFTDAGVLFAVYSQSDWIIEKAAPATLLLATDLVVESLDVSSITFGDAAFLNPPASTTVKGVLELATQEEVDAGKDGRRAIVPRTLKALLDKVLKAYATVKQLTDHAASRDHPAATTTDQGMIELATYTETRDGNDNSRAVTPAALSARSATTGRTGLVELSTDSEALTGESDSVVPSVKQVRAAYGQYGLGASRSILINDFRNAPRFNAFLEGSGGGFTGPMDGYWPALVLRRYGSDRRIVIQASDSDLRFMGATGDNWNEVKTVWHDHNFSPDSKFNKAGGSITGSLSVQGEVSLSSNLTAAKSIGVGTSLSSSKSFSNGKAIAIGDDDSGIRGGGDGTLEVWTNDTKRILVSTTSVSSSLPIVAPEFKSGNTSLNAESLGFGGSASATLINNGGAHKGINDLINAVRGNTNTSGPTILEGAWAGGVAFATQGNSGSEGFWFVANNGQQGSDYDTMLLELSKDRLEYKGYAVWHRGNDAPLLRSDVDDTLTATLNVKGGVTAYSEGRTPAESKIRFGRSADQFIGFTGDAMGNHIHSQCAAGNPKNLMLVVSDGDGGSVNYQFDRSSGLISTSMAGVGLGNADGDKILISSGHHLYYQVNGETVFRVLSNGRLSIAKGGIDAALLDGNATLSELSLNKPLSNAEDILKFDVHRSFSISRRGSSSDSGASLALTSKVSGNAWAVYHEDDQIVSFGTGGAVQFAKEIDVSGKRVWHKGNMGSGSGLDADLLDGKHASHFLPRDDYDPATIRGSGGTRLSVSSSGNLDMHDGNGYIFRVNASGGIDRANGGIDANLLNISLGGVGSYALMVANGGGVDPGNTVSGSRLRYASCNGDKRGSSPSGTWRLMGCLNNSDGDASDSTSLYLRIS